MRSRTVDERALMAGALAQYHFRAQVRNGSGTFKELTNLGGVNFFNGATFNGSIDNPVVTATFRFRKKIGTASLAPLMEASGLNRLDDGITYAPLLNSGRAIQAFVAVTDPGVAPVSGDWHMIFDGKIDRVDWADRRELTLTCRDKGAYLLDNTIIESKRFSVGGGELVEVVMQQEIDAYEGNATLVIPDPPDPAWVIKEFDQDIDVSLLQAIRNLAEQIGWTVRYEWTTGDNFELLFFEPDRAKTVEDDTFGPSEYIDVPVMGFDDEGVRNDIIGWFRDKTIGKMTFRRLTHPGSIAEFGRRPMVLSEEATSAIDTVEEMDRMLEAIIADLAIPIADKGIRTKLFWPVQLGDLYAFPPNNDHYDSTQKFAVIAWQHEFTVTGNRRVANAYTTMTLRGQPAGGYRTWLNKAGPPGIDGLGLPAPVFGELLGEGSALGGTVNDGRIWWEVTWDDNTEFVTIWAEESEDAANVSTPDVNSTAEMCGLFYRPEGVEGFDRNFSTTIPIAIRPGFGARVIGAGFNKQNQRGLLTTPPSVIAEDNDPPYVDGEVTSLDVSPTTLLDGYEIVVGVGAIDPTTESWLFVERDNSVVFRIPLNTTGSRTIGMSDLGLYSGVSHSYMAYIWTRGQSGTPRLWNVSGNLPVSVGPRFARNSPAIVLVSGIPVLYVGWECSDPLADGIDLEMSGDLVTWTYLFSDVVSAPGTVAGQWYISWTQPAYFRLVSKAGSVKLTYTMPVWFDGKQTVPGGSGSAAPILSKIIKLVNGFPQLYIGWTNDNGAADTLILEQSAPGAGVWSTLFEYAAAPSGEYNAAAWTFTAKDYRMRAVDSSGPTTLATSATLAYDGGL